jgi:hypothetical protein
MINDTLFDVCNVLIKDKNKFPDLSDALKEKYFFIINRYLSKGFPEFASELNHKKIDKSLAFDCWYYFLYNKPYPKWIWSKATNKPTESEDDGFSEKEKMMLLRYYGLRLEDIDYLVKWFPKQVKEDLKWLLQIEKENK